MSSSLYRQQLEAWLKRIDVKANSVLDVGGGQKSIKGRLGSFKVKNYKVLDHDTQFNPDYFEDLNYEISLREKFDIVFCLEVFEYIFSPLIAHQNLYNFLNEDGIAYLSYPVIYPLHPPQGIDYLRYTKNAVEKLLAESGFKTWEITPRIASNGREALMEFYSQEQMRPMKGTPEILDIGYLCKAFK